MTAICCSPPSVARPTSAAYGIHDAGISIEGLRLSQFALPLEGCRSMLPLAECRCRRRSNRARDAARCSLLDVRSAPKPSTGHRFARRIRQRACDQQAADDQSSESAHLLPPKFCVFPNTYASEQGEPNLRRSRQLSAQGTKFFRPEAG